MQPNLKKAFETTMIDRIINDVPEMPDHVFSEEFERKMRKLIYGSKLHTVHRNTKRRIFTYIMVAIVAAVITACSVDPFREFFKKFFMEVFYNHTVVQSDNYDEAPNEITDIYKITNVPNGFELTYEDDVFDCMPFVVSEYRNGNKYILFTQYVKSKYDLNVNTENYSMEFIKIKNYDGYIIDYGDDKYYLTWDNGEYIFSINSNIGRNSLINVAKSVQKVES